MMSDILLLSCLMKLCQLLCLKYWGKTTLEKVVELYTRKMSPLSDQEIRCWILASSSILSQLIILSRMYTINLFTCIAFLQNKVETLFLFYHV